LEVIGYLLARNPFSREFIFAFGFYDAFESLVKSACEFVNVAVHFLGDQIFRSDCQTQFFPTRCASHTFQSLPSM
jgi:hypothetical protein